ncbi:MAG TPA: M23 family metallopeptidase [Gaiellaceae bacterium]|nr:M23 family metallopeptidase [Gaiellaceae bacterium]
MRRGSALVAAAAALLALGVAAGRGSGFTTTEASTTAPTTTAAASTATVTTTTTAPTSTAATTTTAALAAQPLAAACAGSGLLAIVPPQGAPSLVGPPADAQQAAELTSSAGDPILDVEGASTEAPTCSGSRPLPASTSIGSLSLFGGALAADGIDVGLVPAAGGWSVTRTLGVVTIGGAPLPPTAPAAQRRLGDWGVVSLPASATGAAEAGGAWLAGALVVRLTRAHAGLAAGTTLYVGYVEAATPPQPLPAPRAKRTPRVATRAAAAPPPRRRHRRKHHHGKKRISRPLTVTPPLHGGPYVFPVVGEVDWGDSYGGPRSDVSGGWHHGDDLFAPLGRPVVAAADGTVYLVGWEKLGGWRLWLKDRADDRFYYAHLSGYTALARNGRKVKAGQVLGFVGNTGDAFTTPDHLHFEIHPVSLLPLRYDGAVDPTTYLRGWRHESPASVPLPRALPPGASTHGEGAVTDYRKLLSARGLAPRPAKARRPAPPAGPRPFPEQRLVALPQTPAAVAQGGGTSPLLLVLAPLVAIALTSLLLFREPIRSRLRKARS